MLSEKIYVFRAAAIDIWDKSLYNEGENGRASDAIEKNERSHLAKEMIL